MIAFILCITDMPFYAVLDPIGQHSTASIPSAQASIRFLN
jgi:hypothetical protein